MQCFRKGPIVFLWRGFLPATTEEARSNPLGHVVEHGKIQLDETDRPCMCCALRYLPMENKTRHGRAGGKLQSLAQMCGSLRFRDCVPNSEHYH